MAKLWASAPDKDAYAGRSGPANDHSAAERPGASAALDPEMLDLVQRFERGYAELAPAADEAPARNRLADDLFPDFPDVFADSPPAPPARMAPVESARVVPMPRREPEWSAPAPTPAPASQASAWPREARADNAEVDLDEAMAILRASEQRGRQAADPSVDPDDQEAPRAAEPGMPRRERERSARSATRETESEAPASSSQAMEWASRSRTARTVVVAVAGAALCVGIGAGYLIARSPSVKAPSSVIESSRDGGTQLRLERNLPRS